MTVRERVLASRLVQKIDDHEKYSTKIGLSYAILASEAYSKTTDSIHAKEKKG